ncbi:hypothetical protein SAY86_002233 [Trapa natans]|uniref:Protein LAZY 1 n=1 Tax=Trapa natans TaxID=22666 RepID=A0AAN7LIU3_TRANT|nr:hypothetical protein SAY86_002233 [Trapa natans]
MKFLGWMHRKLRDNTIEPLKDLAIGNYCTCLSAQQLHEDEDLHVSTRFGSKYAKHEYYEINFDARETLEVIPDLFHGLLTIGTLGSSGAPIITDPPTPTFAVSLDDITEKITSEVTPADLKFINEELEKFIEAESEEEAYNGTSRNSYVSAVTLFEAPACPLQGYLFGSMVEQPGTRSLEKNRKVSLGQLFEETKQEDSSHKEKTESEDMQRKAVGENSKGLVKKVLKKLKSSSSRGSNDGHFDVNHDNPAPMKKKKFQKVLQMFHKKVHPENSATSKDWRAKVLKGHKKKNTNFFLKEHWRGQDYDTSLPHEPKSKWIPPYPSPTDNFLDESEGHWIKTDADYLVLEL